MRKTLLLLVAAIVCGGYAAEVDAPMARSAASSWLGGNSAFAVAGSVDRAKQVITVCDTNAARTVLWHQVPLTGGGCVVVAPVTEIEPVITVVDKGFSNAQIPASHPLRAILERDMRARLRFLGLYREDPSGGAMLMSAAPSGPKDATAAQVAKEWAEQSNAKWAKITRPAGVAPMNEKEGLDNLPLEVKVVEGFEAGGYLTHWNQMGDDARNPCYNYYTPRNYPSGCTATAAAAVMQFFKVKNSVEGYPETYAANARRPSIDRVDVELRSIGGDYDWSKFEGMTRADYDVLDEEKREILGRLVYDIGVGVRMQYEQIGSGAYVADLAEVFRNQFGFVDARSVQTTQQHFEKLIYNQCRAGAPVIMSIDGHAVVAVGYGVDEWATSRTRVFLGWGGTGDGWYALPYINTASVVGGTTYLSEVVEFVITMIAYEEKTTVPVCARVVPPINGSLDLVAIEADGTETVLEQVEMNSGFAGVRVEPLPNAVRMMALRNTALGITGTFAIPADNVQNLPEANRTFNGGDLIFEFLYDADELCNATPAAQQLLQLHAMTAASFDEGMKLAQGYRFDPVTGLWKMDPAAPKRALLVVSGTFGAGGDRTATDEIYNILRDMDDADYNGFRSKYVVAFVTPNPKSITSDGDPSIAIFNSRVMNGSYGWSPVNRCAYWSAYNMRYETDLDLRVRQLELRRFYGQMDYPEPGIFTVTNQYPFDKYYSLPYVTAAVQKVLDDGGAAWDIDAANIKLTVSGNLPESEVPGLYGVYERQFGEGEFRNTFPGVVTNKTKGVIYEYQGWTVEDDANPGVIIAQGETPEVSFPMVKDAQYTLVNNWEPAKYRITALPEPAEAGTVRLDAEWVAAGESVTAVAIPAAGQSFVQWFYTGGFGEHERTYGSRRGCTITFTVDEPAELTATFDICDLTEEEIAALGSAQISFRSVVLTGSTGWVAYNPSDWTDFSDPAIPQSQLFGVVTNSEIAVSSTSGSVSIPATKPIALLMPQTVITNAHDSTQVWRMTGYTASAFTGFRKSDVYGLTPRANLNLTVTWHWEPVTTKMEFAIEWNDTMDNLREGDYVLKTRDELPPGFDPATADIDLGVAPKGWVLGEPQLNADGDLVVPMSLDAAVLAPQPPAGQASPITIKFVDGKLVVEAEVANGVTGFVYRLYAADELAGPWTLAAVVEAGDVPSRQAAADGTVELGVSCDPAKAKRFYKLVVEAPGAP